jgi:hypothetical protein
MRALKPLDGIIGTFCAKLVELIVLGKQVGCLGNHRFLAKKTETDFVFRRKKIARGKATGF